jgi:hypothetical protein
MKQTILADGLDCVSVPAGISEITVTLEGFVKAAPFDRGVCSTAVIMTGGG